MAEAIEFVDMKHPGTGGAARASRRAFDRTWSLKGWQLAEAGDVDAAARAEFLDVDVKDVKAAEAKAEKSGGRAAASDK